jgi:predicted nucleic-acid-binding protein
VTGLDTNVVLSLLFSEEEPILPAPPPYYLSRVVLAEFAWVMARRFDAGRDRIAQALAGLLALKGFVVDRAQIVQVALDDFRTGSADFADCLILHGNADAGCTTTLTQDRKAARHAGFTLLS